MFWVIISKINRQLSKVPSRKNLHKLTEKLSTDLIDADYTV